MELIKMTTKNDSTPIWVIFGIAICSCLMLGSCDYGNSWESLYLGKIELMKGRSRLRVDFKVPSKEIAISLVSDSKSLLNGKYCQCVDFPLNVKVVICEKYTKRKIFSGIIKQPSIVYANWHSPKATLYLKLKKDLSGLLELQKLYTLKVEILFSGVMFNSKVFLEYII